MIKTLSPYYINTPFFSEILNAVCLRYRLQVFVWSGLKQAVPNAANYEITIENVQRSDGSNTINISRIINDFINFKAIDSEDGFTDLVDSPNQNWVKTQVFYTAANGIETTIPEHEDTQISLKGYGYGMSGENPDVPFNKFLININEYTMSDSGTFIVPIVLDEPEATATSITITNVENTSLNKFRITFTFVGDFLSLFGKLKPNINDVPTPAEEYFEVGLISPLDYSFETEITGSSTLQLSGYDFQTNQYILSNIFNFTVL